MKNKFLFVIALLCILIISSETSLQAQSVKFKKRPVNVILFIGDGMGPAQVSAGIVRSDNT